LIFQLSIAVVLIGLYVVLLQFRETYLSGIQFMNVSNSILFLWIILYILLNELLPVVVAVSEDIRALVTVVSIALLIAALFLMVYFTAKFEEEKKKKAAEWNNWEEKKKQIPRWRRLLFYYGVEKTL
jgi:hypothetical protein